MASMGLHCRYTRPASQPVLSFVVALKKTFHTNHHQVSIHLLRQPISAGLANEWHFFTCTTRYVCTSLALHCDRRSLFFFFGKKCISVCCAQINQPFRRPFHRPPTPAGTSHNCRNAARLFHCVRVIFRSNFSVAKGSAPPPSPSSVYPLTA